MQEAIDRFRLNIIHIRNIQALYISLRSMTTSVIDLSDLLRVQIVMSVSALDYYVHEVARIGMLEIFDGSRPATTAYGRFNISLNSALQGRADASNAWLDSEIRLRHGFLSFQQPDRIADACRLISEVELWNTVGGHMGQDPKAVKNKLQLIVERRNKIVHEADADPSFPGVRWPITATDVEGTTDFIEEVGETLHSVIA
jgi:hypothetical protein